MPITRIPVVHKFGIISQSQRVGLEERIAKKALSETRCKVLSQRTVPRPLPFEVTEDFVYKFNDSCQEERRKLEDTAMKMLKRLKRLAGLREAGEVVHADLPRAWVDLALLAQCRNQKLEDGCLETLVASLDQALVSEEHVLSLFYLAKSGIHWLKRDPKNEAVLRTGEIKLLKMTHLVFLRLYCHHLLGQLKEYGDQQTSLAQYLEGFSEKEQLYDQFPGAHLSVRFIIESGYVICTLTKSEDFTQSKLQPEAKRVELLSQEPEPSTETSFRTNNAAEFSEECNTNKDALAEDKGYSTVKRNVDGSYHFGDRTFLWHSLNVWHVAINDQDARVRDFLYGLFQNASHLARESWLDVVFAFYILSDASQHHVRVLKAFQYSMSLEFSTLSVPVDPVTLCETCYSSFSNTHCGEKKTCNSVLFCKDSSKNSDLESQKTNSSPNVLQKLQAFVGSDLTEHERITPDSNHNGNNACIGSNKHSTISCKWENERADESVNDDVMQNTDSMEKSKNESQSVKDSQITRDARLTANTELAKDAGVSRNFEMKDNKKTDQDFSSVAQSVRTRVGARQQRHHWPWELVYTFCECMTRICLHGTSSNIQKISLMGDGTVSKGYDRGMKRSYGLIDFIQYDQGKDGWRVRYAAVQGLVRICHHYYGDATKEGLTNTAWSALMCCQSTEKDPRVLDAIKVAKVEAELHNKLAKDHIPVSLWTSRLASALTKILHSHGNPVHAPEPSPTISNECCTTKTSRERPVKTESDSCAKPSLRQEIALSNTWSVPQLSYTTRRNLELRAVIEDQWKKQLLEEMEKEIETNVGELKKKRDKELKIE